MVTATNLQKRRCIIACRAFPEPQGNDLASGPKRNFQVLSPLDFLAEFTQHIPTKGAHLIRYYGWYSNKNRGLRRKATVEAAAVAQADGAVIPPPGRCSQTWAMLIKRVYEVDALACWAWPFRIGDIPLAFPAGNGFLTCHGESQSFTL